MRQAVVNAFEIPDLRRRIPCTIVMPFIFRGVTHIPVPGVAREALDRSLRENQLLGMLNLRIRWGHESLALA
jgi:preprotein translocase subunit SecY